MHWENLLWIVYAAAHTAAGTLWLVLETAAVKAQQAGILAWGVPGVCLALLVLDLTGRGRLGGTARLTAACALPALCGELEVLAVEQDQVFSAAPAVWGCALSLLLLAGYTLLRDREPEEEALSQAASLLARGSAMGTAGKIWLRLLAGLVLFMATFGFLISLIVGSLMAMKNTLLDYSGVKGILVGLLILYVMQVLWYSRALRLVEAADPGLDTERLGVARFVPLWGGRQAWKLYRQLQLRGVKANY